MTVLRCVLAFAVGYLIGNISFSNIMSKALAKKDIRTLGSGNAGAANILRNFGLKYAVPVFFADAMKAVISSLLGCLIIGRGFDGFSLLYGFTSPYVLIGGLGAIIGHNFPVFMGFKGGKGVSCSLGMLLVLNPWMGLIFIVFAIFANIYIKVYSIVSIVTMYLASVTFSLFDARGDIYEIVFLWFLFLLMVFMHRKNIVRLFKGEEKQIKIFKN